MAKVYIQDQEYFVWDGGHYGRALSQAFLGTGTHTWDVLATGLKAGYTKPRKTGSSSAFRKFTEQKWREPLRDAWPSTCSRGQGSEEKKPKSPQPEESEPGWAEKDPAS